MLGSAGNLPGPMRLTFLVSLLAMALLYITLWKYEMAAKNVHAPGCARCGASSPATSR